MAVTSPAVSSQDAQHVTPGTTTGASLLSKEKSLHATPEAANHGVEPPHDSSATISNLRPPNPQAGTLPLGPQPSTSRLSNPPGEAVPPPTRAEKLERPAKEQELSRTVMPGSSGIVRDSALEEEGVPASQAERATFGYWRSGRSQAKGPVEGLEEAAGSLKEEGEDLIGAKLLSDPEKITYWKPGRVADPVKYSPAALAALPVVLTNQAKGVGEAAEKAIEAAKQEDLDQWQSLIEPDKVTYWRPGRVADPAKYAPAALAALPSVFTSQAKDIRDGLRKAVDTVNQEDLEKPLALIEPDKITYWKPGRVADPAKYAPAALAALPAALKDIGQSHGIPLSVPTSAPPPVPPRQSASKWSHSEYSDYRSSDISFHSSHATLSSGQRRPLSGVRNAVSSPYL